MKKTTVITTETREVWVISDGGVTHEKSVHPQPDDFGEVDGDEIVVPRDSGDQTTPPVLEKGT